MTRTHTALIAGTIGLGLICSGCSAIGVSATDQREEAAETATIDASASAHEDPDLGKLKVKGKAPKTGYDREEKFGRSWIDVDQNGCDTRNDVLARDLEDITLDDDECTILGGVLDDPYTGKTINFTRGQDTSSEVQIDHRVALMNAWQTGAQQISQSQREALANDPENLASVDGRANSQKSDGDTATWLPSNKDYRCQYVESQVSVKIKYDLWVTPAEKDAMSRELSKCE